MCTQHNDFVCYVGLKMTDWWVETRSLMYKEKLKVVLTCIINSIIHANGPYPNSGPDPIEHTHSTVSQHNYFFISIMQSLQQIPECPTLSHSCLIIQLNCVITSHLSHLCYFPKPSDLPWSERPNIILKQRGLCISTACTFFLQPPVKYPLSNSATIILPAVWESR